VDCASVARALLEANRATGNKMENTNVYHRFPGKNF
jgi:hypothetical protein